MSECIWTSGAVAEVWGVLAVNQSLKAQTQQITELDVLEKNS